MGYSNIISKLQAYVLKIETNHTRLFHCHNQETFCVIVIYEFLEKYTFWGVGDPVENEAKFCLALVVGHSYLYLGEFINDLGALCIFIIFCVEYCDIHPSLSLNELKYTL